MTGVILLVERLLSPGSAGGVAHLVAAGVPIVIAVPVYGALLLVLRVEEATLVWNVVTARFMRQPAA